MKVISTAAFAFIVLSSLASVGAAGFEQLKLQDIYGFPIGKVESIVLSTDKEMCDGLISSYTQGVNDPAHLNAAQFCAVQNYSNSRYSINKQLWLTDSTGSALSGTDWAYVRVLDMALAKIKTEKPTLVYRGAARKDIQFSKVGQIVRLKGYTSTSPNREVAEEFIKDRLMIIKALSGKNIKSYSNAGSEDEFLLPRSTFVRFDGAEIKTLELFTDEGPEQRKVEIVYLTEMPK